MPNGYAGKIARVNLSTKTVTSIDTARYQEFGGGFGIGAAIFWDLVAAPGEWDMKNAYDPRNVITLMSGALAGTGIPGAGRTSVSGVSPEVYPSHCFQRANFGGRFATALKIAGWDGIVLEGKADRPVWINVINDKITIEDAKSLWGLNTYETQDRIVSMVTGRTRFGDEWQQIGESYTTARPQIVCIGPVGEAVSSLAALVHGSGVTARTGGYGGVFGSKNLKAISVTGTGSIKPADPKGVVEARLQHMLNSRTNPAEVQAGTACCMPCIKNDRKRNSFYGGESMCADAQWFVKDGMRGADIAIKWGMSTWGSQFGGVMQIDVPGAPELFKKRVPDAPGLGWYIKYLYDLGILGPGKKIDSYPLQMEQWANLSFREDFCEAVARRTGIGDTLAEGTLRAAAKWERLEEDKNSGALRFPAWGSVFHWTMPGIEWAYGSLLGAGDIVWHGFVDTFGPNTGSRDDAAKRGYTVEKLIELMSAKTIPYTGDPYMFNYAWQGEEARKTGIYSEHKARQVAWARHYATFWNESMAFCEMVLPLFINTSRPDFSGPSPDVEIRYYNAVTGNNIGFAETIEIGRKIYNLERSIRVLQGRHRDQEKFSPYVYKPGAAFINPSGGEPVYQDGKWSWQLLSDMYLDDAGVELFKTNFYRLEGWDASSGWPTRKTLQGLALNKVADVLAAKNRIGN
jgi:aldehyde:ferredoxin oxidoreductase